MMNINRAITTAAISGAIAVALGALGAHWLKNQVPGGQVTLDQVNGFDTGVKYQMYHTLAMLAVLVLSGKLKPGFAKWSFNCFLIGIVMFSGSLYFLCTRGLYNADYLKFLGPVTPVGGLFFIAGWLLLAFSVFKQKQDLPRT